MIKSNVNGTLDIGSTMSSTTPLALPCKVVRKDRLAMMLEPCGYHEDFSRARLLAARGTEPYNALQFTVTRYIFWSVLLIRTTIERVSTTDINLTSQDTLRQRCLLSKGLHLRERKRREEIVEMEKGGNLCKKEFTNLYIG